jgi:hypothetical protein
MCASSTRRSCTSADCGDTSVSPGCVMAPQPGGEASCRPERLQRPTRLRTGRTRASRIRLVWETGSNVIGIAGERSAYCPPHGHAPDKRLGSTPIRFILGRFAFAQRRRGSAGQTPAKVPGSPEGEALTPENVPWISRWWPQASSSEVQP